MYYGIDQCTKERFADAVWLLKLISGLKRKNKNKIKNGEMCLLNARSLKKIPRMTQRANCPPTPCAHVYYCTG